MQRGRRTGSPNARRNLISSKDPNPCLPSIRLASSRSDICAQQPSRSSRPSWTLDEKPFLAVFASSFLLVSFKLQSLFDLQGELRRWLGLRHRLRCIRLGGHRRCRLWAAIGTVTAPTVGASDITALPKSATGSSTSNHFGPLWLHLLLVVSPHSVRIEPEGTQQTTRTYQLLRGQPSKQRLLAIPTVSRPDQNDGHEYQYRHRNHASGVSTSSAATETSASCSASRCGSSGVAVSGTKDSLLSVSNKPGG